jgi:hypothetical protein
MYNKIRKKFIFMGLVTTMILVTILSIPSNAGSRTSHELVKIWDGTYGDDSFNNQAFSVYKTNDNGYILAGCKTFQNQVDLYYVKTDSNGIFSWERTISDPSHQNTARCIQQTTDGGYIITGSSIDYQMSSVILIKTDSDGHVVWSRTYDNGIGYCVQQTTDGGYIIAGTSYTVDGRDMWLIKTFADGRVDWDETFNVDINDIGMWVETTNDNCFILTGYSYYPNVNPQRCVLIKVDANGIGIWCRQFGQPSYDYRGNCVKQTEDGGFIICGTNYQLFHGFCYNWLLKTSPDGIEQWTENYNTGEAFSIELTSDRGYIVTGRTLANKVYLLKTDQNGIQEAENFFGYYGFGYSVLEESMGNYIVGGFTIKSAGQRPKMYLLKSYLSNNYPELPRIDGPLTGQVGIPYIYTVSTIDPESDTVFYNINWDTTSPPSTEWFGPYLSGTPIDFTHAWDTPGIYTIGVKAKDKYNAESQYSYLTVRIIP